MGDVEKWHSDVKDNHMNKDGSSDHSTRVAVVSCDGMARAGVYCAAFTSVEQVNFQIFKILKYLAQIFIIGVLLFFFKLWGKLLLIVLGPIRILKIPYY